MLSSLIAFTFVATASIAAQEECPCMSLDPGNTIMICSNPSLASIPDCVPSNVSVLSIRTPSIPLVPQTIRRLTDLSGLYIGLFDNPQISKDFLSGQPNISTFMVHHTTLEYVDRDWFQFSPRITALHLHNNKIVSLDSDTFSSLPLLQRVLLDGNQLSSLPPTLFQGTALKYLFLDGNPWRCDCELATFMQWARDHGVTLGGGAFCLYPQELEGLDLINLTLDLACKK